jgi:hypothetical protein
MPKALATALNKSKKKKRFFLFRFKTTSHRLRLSVASAERYATLMNAK